MLPAGWKWVMKDEEQQATAAKQAKQEMGSGSLACNS